MTGINQQQARMLLANHVICMCAIITPWMYHINLKAAGICYLVTGV